MQLSIINQSGAVSNSAVNANAKANVQANASTLNYNAFLQLLLAQMRNQDPTTPTDSTQWVSQLATFSSVEQSIQANAKLDQILQNTNFAEAEALIGRTVTSADGTISGVVVSVVMTSEGTIAKLDNDKTLTIAPGVTVSK